MVRALTQLNLIEAFFYIIVGWVLISIWQKFFDNFLYKSLPFRRGSTYHNFIIAIVCTGIFLVLIGSANSIIQKDFTNIFSTGPTFTGITSPFGETVPAPELNNFEILRASLQ